MILEGKKFCSVCSYTKPITDFSRSKSESDGYRYQCKPCSSYLSREYYKRNKRRGYERSIKRRYGLEPAAYASLLAASDGGCASCGEKGALHVDHDHKSGRVRALLCPPCNKALGLLQEDPNRIAKLAKYAENLQ